jgi:hypothetical protein
LSRRAPGLLLRGALLGAALLSVAACRSEEPRAHSSRFTRVADGVEYARLLGDIDGHAFRIDLERAGLRVLAAGGPTTRREVAKIARRLPAAVAINGSFFDETDKAMGLVVDQGRLVSRGRYKPWGALVVKDRRASLTTGADVKLDDQPDLVIQGWPRLVVDGVVAKLKPQAAARTAVCAEQQHVTFVVVPEKVDATVLALTLAKSERQGGLGCKQALNLDGGPSTQLSAKLGALSVRVDGGWGVPNALVAIPGLPATAPVPAEPLPADAGAEVAASRPPSDR